MASFLARNTASCQLEDGSHGCPYRQRASFGGAPMAFRHPITCLTARLPMGCEVPESGIELLTHDNSIRAPTGGDTTDFPAMARNSSICDAPMAHRENGGPESPPDSIFV